MDVTLQAAVIGALFTFFGALLTILMNFYRERSEREKWRRTLELEERKIKHEKIFYPLRFVYWFCFQCTKGRSSKND